MNNIIVGMGEALWDVLPEGKKIGGAPANFAYHVSQFGFDSRVVSAVGDDELGDEILRVFNEKKLKTQIERVDYPTGTVQVTLDDEGVVYAAFNRDYVSDDAISAWDGSIDGIYQILQGVKWDKSDTPRFEYLINGYRFDDMLGCEIRNGLCFDYDTMSVGNPLESQKFTGYLRVLDRMKKDGYMSDDLTNEITYLNNPGLNDAQILKNIKAGNFAAALCVGSVDENFKKDNITVKEVKTYLSSRINGSIGVAKKAKDASAAMDFLSLLYGNEKYGNILLYGEKDKDYKLKDGIAEACDGGSLDDDYRTKLSLNLFVNVYPTKNEKYVDNRKKEFFDFYDNATLSPFIGFEPDTKNMGSISTDLDDFMTGLHGATVDDTLDGAVQKLTADGMDSYLESVRSQWEEYKQ